MEIPFSQEFLDQFISDLKTYGWARRTGVLDPDQISSINFFFDKNKDNFKQASVIDQSGAVVENDYIRGDRFVEADLKTPDPDIQVVIGYVKDFSFALIQHGFKILDCQVHPSFFPELQLFRKHIDVYEGSGHVVTFVFYVNKTWQRADGGILVLYDLKNNLLAEIPPEPGSFVAFLSREVPHEVRLCKRYRRTITGWFHDKKITSDTP